MTIDNDPTKIFNPDLLNNNYIQTLPSGNYRLLEKKLISYLPRCVAKFIHWILNANERIETISDIYNQYIKNLKNFDAVGPLYANMCTLNTHLIEKQSLRPLFWMRVPLIDVTPIEQAVIASINTLRDTLGTLNSTDLAKWKECQQIWNKLKDYANYNQEWKVLLQELKEKIRSKNQEIEHQIKIEKIHNGKIKVDSIVSHLAIIKQQLQKAKEGDMAPIIQSIDTMPNFLEQLKVLEHVLTDPTYKQKMTDAVQSYAQLQAISRAYKEYSPWLTPLLKRLMPLWKKGEAVALSSEELEKLKQLSTSQTVPMRLRMQIQLITRMHDFKFHPQQVCERTMIPLVDPLRNKKDPTKLINRSSAGDFGNYEEGTNLRNLVQEWLLYKDLFKKTYEHAHVLEKRLANYPNPQSNWSAFTEDFSEGIEFFYEDVYIALIQSIWSPTLLEEAKQINHATMIQLETLDVVYRLIQKGYPSTFPKAQTKEQLSVQGYIEALNLVKTNLRIIYENHLSITTHNVVNSEQAEILYENIVNLDYLLNDALAFSAQHFESTKKIVANILYFSSYKLLNLRETGYFPEVTMDVDAAVALYRRKQSNYALAYCLARIQMVENSKETLEAASPEDILHKKAQTIHAELIQEVSKVDPRKIFQQLAQRANVECAKATEQKKGPTPDSPIADRLRSPKKR